MSSIIVAVRLSPTEVKAIEDLITFRHYRSRCHVIREALEALLLKEKLKPEAFRQIRRERPRHRNRSQPKRESPPTDANGGS